MENEDIIKLAVQLTEENNTLYKKAAREQAFMIKAGDGFGIDDTFITVKGPQTADDWKNKFLSAGFSSAVVSPFRSAGNLNFNDVDSTFFTAISNRPKWQISHSPTGVNLPLIDHNPYAGSDIKFDPTDTRVGSGHSFETTNKYQEYIDQILLPSIKSKIFAGWFDGPLMSWVNKLIPLDTSIEEILRKEYAYLYGNAPLQKYILDKDLDPKSFAPTKFQINSLGIKMYTLFNILSANDIELDDFPEDKILPELKDIVGKASAHKFHKQYEQQDMNQFQEKEISDQLEKDTARWAIFEKILRGISR